MMRFVITNKEGFMTQTIKSVLEELCKRHRKIVDEMFNDTDGDMLEGLRMAAKAAQLQEIIDWLEKDL